MLNNSSIIKDLEAIADATKAQAMGRYFKTDKGQYAEGDIFVGISMPDLRSIIKKHPLLLLSDIELLLRSPVHEYRMAALLLLMSRYKRIKHERDSIFEFYLNNLVYINNWDLVDVSCRDIIGVHLMDKDREILYDLAEGLHLWSQRVAMVSTWYFIKHKQFGDTFRLAELLLSHSHDLMHKAVGWMLREVGKRDELALEEFIETHARQMSRTTLRYAIERFEEKKRQYFLKL
jgi:3-methyladenine DNA glycosylase AlkD